MNLNCLVVDDEPLALELMVSYVKRTPFLTLQGTCAGAVEALHRLEQSDIDLIFLDIQMPELNGLELSRLIGNRTKIIFTTAFEQYAVEGFKVDAVDYLLKPISYPEFLRAAQKALHRHEQATAAPTTPTNATAPTPITHTFVRSGNKLIRLTLDDILYIEGMQDYVKIHLATQSAPVVTLLPMKNFEETLPLPFLRIHRSYIVNLDKITMIERNRIYIGSIALSVSDSYRPAFLQQINRRTLN